MRSFVLHAHTILLSLFFVILSCNKQEFPNGTCHTGQKSYQAGPLSVWQESLRPWLIEQLGMTEALAQIKKQSAPAFKLVEKEPKILKNSTRLYHVSYLAFDGRELLGFLLLPSEGANTTEGTLQERSSLIILHGHSKTKENVVFDQQDTFKHIATRAAMQGTIVFIPDQRGFGENQESEEHYAWIKKTPQTGSFMKMQVLDVLKAQHTLEALDLGSFGLQGKVGARDNRILGLSLGGYVALLAGAIDTAFEVISTQSHFFPFEYLFSPYHCACQHIPAFGDQINITDLALMIPPRKLKIGLGLRDRYVTGFVTSALDGLVKQAAVAGTAICADCSLALTVDKVAGHEVVSDDAIATQTGKTRH